MVSSGVVQQADGAGDKGAKGGAVKQRAAPAPGGGAAGASAASPGADALPELPEGAIMSAPPPDPELADEVGSKGKLRHLGLSTNSLLNEGAKSLAQALAKGGNDVLRSLDLSFNGIGGDGLEELEAALALESDTPWARKVHELDILLVGNHDRVDDLMPRHMARSKQQYEYRRGKYGPGSSQQHIEIIPTAREPRAILQSQALGDAFGPVD